MNICNLCNKEFSNKYALKKHILTVKKCGNVSISFECKICNKNFTSNSQLKNHKCKIDYSTIIEYENEIEKLRIIEVDKSQKSIKTDLKDIESISLDTIFQQTPITLELVKNPYNFGIFIGNIFKNYVKLTDSSRNKLSLIALKKYHTLEVKKFISNILFKLKDILFPILTEIINTELKNISDNSTYEKTELCLYNNIKTNIMECNSEYIYLDHCVTGFLKIQCIVDEIQEALRLNNITI